MREVAAVHVVKRLSRSCIDARVSGAAAGMHVRTVQQIGCVLSSQNYDLIIHCVPSEC